MIGAKGVNEYYTSILNIIREKLDRQAVNPVIIKHLIILWQRQLIITLKIKKISIKIK